MRTEHLVLIVACLLGRLAIAQQPVNELPMYGETNLSKNAEEANRQLIDWATHEYKNLALASKDAAQRGWKAYYQGDLETAIKRFNQAWLFDKENPEAYWGFGLVMGQRASEDNPETSLKDSIRFLQMANERAPKNGRIMGDLAFSHTILGHYYESETQSDAEAQKQFETAGELFVQAFKADSEYPPTVANWSVFYFYTGDYQKAKSKADEAMKMGYSFSPDYISDLQAKMK